MNRKSPPNAEVDRADHHAGANSHWRMSVAATGLFFVTVLLVVLLQEAPLAQVWIFALIGLTVLLPYAVWLIVVLRYDHWTPRPWALVMMALAWGCLISFLAAIALEVSFDALAEAVGAAYLDTMIIAPFWEEAAKGLFIVLLYAYARRHLRGPWDGLVYGVLVGAGFGFTEDVGFLSSSLSEGGVSDLVVTYLIREIFTAHAHPMFTAATGLAAGLAAQRGLSPGRAFWWIFCGFLIAFALHAIFDTASVAVPYGGIVSLVLGPIYAVIFVIALRRLRWREVAMLQDAAR